MSTEGTFGKREPRKSVYEIFCIAHCTGRDVVKEGGESDDDDYSCLAEWHAIQKRLKRVDVSMKGAIRDQLREIAFPETTSLKPPKEKVAPKGGKKKKVFETHIQNELVCAFCHSVWYR
ncbi:hypothetical protein P8452_26105 [Trifolium repens]|nr:hypothetical protein P8452_26105 [Trifolium repens]